MYYKSLQEPMVNTWYAQRVVFDTLAEVWLDLGAQAFGIWGNCLLVCWPKSAWDDMAKLGASDTVIYAPIKVEEHVIGKIGVVIANTPQRKAHLNAEALLISTIVEMKTRFESAATELMSQAQLKTEIDMTASIQLQLLEQKLPQIDGLDMYAYSNPAAQVGGDFYDFCFYKNRPLIFAVGDISGKGLPAALIMAMTRVVLRAAARSMTVVDPGTILVRMNEDLYDDFTDVGMFATVFVGCYDVETEQLIYANAGHAPAIYCPVDGPAVLLEADVPVVGVVPLYACGKHSTAFNANDVLLVGTDGLNESINLDGEMFGYERLLHTVKSLAHLSANQIGTELVKIVNQFAEGQSQFDDQTVVVIKKEYSNERTAFLL